MSRFREDLPELPISPPASRMQSPDAEGIYTIVKTPVGQRKLVEALPSPSTFRERHDTPISAQPSVEMMRERPSTFGHPDEPGVSPEPPMSLASIDSEGSWFSGKRARKRKSSCIMGYAPALQLPRRTPESDSERRPEHVNANDDMDITDDEYLSRLAPPHGDRPALNRQSTGEARPSSDWGEEEAHWGSVSRQPTVVRSRAAGRVKSSEGMLKSFGEPTEGTIEYVDQDDNSDAGEGTGLQRATSIDYGKAHARRISAGSARLLSITPRSSVDAKQTTLHPSAKNA